MKVQITNCRYLYGDEQTLMRHPNVEVEVKEYHDVKDAVFKEVGGWGVSDIRFVATYAGNACKVTYKDEKGELHVDVECGEVIDYLHN